MSPTTSAPVPSGDAGNIAVPSVESFFSVRYVSWENVGAPRYELQRRASGSGKPFERIYEGDGLSFVDGDAPSDMEYEYRVRALLTRRRRNLRSDIGDAFSEAAQSAPLLSLDECSYAVKDARDALAHTAHAAVGSAAYVVGPKEANGDAKDKQPLLVAFYPAQAGEMLARLYAEAAAQTLSNGGTVSALTSAGAFAYLADASAVVVVLPDTLDAPDALDAARAVTNGKAFDRSTCALLRPRSEVDVATLEADATACRFVAVHGPTVALDDGAWVTSVADAASRLSAKTFMYIAGRGDAAGLTSALDARNYRRLPSIFGVDVIEGRSALALAHEESTYLVEARPERDAWDFRLDVSGAITGAFAFLSAPDVSDVLKEKPTSRNNVRMNLVFGINGIDRSKVNPNDIFSSFVGTVVYDELFDASDEAVQSLVDRTCELVGNRTDLAMPLSDADVGSTDGHSTGRFEIRNCVMSDFRAFVEARGIAFPVDRRYFYTHFAEFLADQPDHRYDVGVELKRASELTPDELQRGWSNQYADAFHGDLNSLRAPRDSSDVAYVRLSWVRLQFKTPMAEMIPSFDAYNVYHIWSKVVADLRDRLGRSSVLTSCDLWPRMVTEVEAVEGTTRSLVIAVTCAFLSILFFTGDISLSILTTATLMSILASLLAVLRAFGWSIGAVEAISMAILVGCSVDFCLHVAEAYAHVHVGPAGGDEPERAVRAREALALRGPSVLSSAVTTVGACLPLTLCTLQILTKFGVMMSAIISIAILTTLTLFVAMLMRWGPEQGKQAMIVKVVEATCLSTSARCAATTLVLASAVCFSVAPLRSAVLAHSAVLWACAACVVAWLVWEWRYLKPRGADEDVMRKGYSWLTAGGGVDDDEEQLELAPLRMPPPSPLSSFGDDEAIGEA